MVLSVEIADINGQLVRKYPIEDGQNHKDISAIRKGLYLAILYTDQGLTTQKVAIVN